jgi:hypothetical protein
MPSDAPTTCKMALSAREAAQTLSICPKTLWSHTIPRGTIPCFRVGTRVLYDPADLRVWIQKMKGGAAK